MNEKLLTKDEVKEWACREFEAAEYDLDLDRVDFAEELARGYFAYLDSLASGSVPDSAGAAGIQSPGTSANRDGGKVEMLRVLKDVTDMAEAYKDTCMGKSTHDSVIAEARSLLAVEGISEN